MRRANPSNRWLLSTNTDMIFIPQSGRSLSEICAELSDGFYGLPGRASRSGCGNGCPGAIRFGRWPRSERLGPGLRLDEPTVSNEWIRFDAPGDFQLILREDFLAIDGLDEEMLLGYHVDSNPEQADALHRGSSRALGRASRLPLQPQPRAHRLPRYGQGRERSRSVRRQGRSGGAAVATRYLGPSRRRARGGAGPGGIRRTGLGGRRGRFDSRESRASNTFDAARVPFELTYDSGHVLPFVADSLAVSPSDATIGYLGANPVLERMLASAVERLGFQTRLEMAGFDDLGSVDDLARIADVFVVDFGVDASLVDASLSPSGFHEPAQLPARLDGA